MTRYVVVCLKAEGGLNEVARVEASGVKTAIRQAVNNGVEHGKGDHFAAIPLRNWNFLPVAVETQRRVRVG